MSDRGIISKALEKIGSEHTKFAETNLDIAQAIQKGLEQKGWDQQDLAKAMGKQNSEISKWLSGTHNFTLKTLTRIEACLGKELVLSRKQAFERFGMSTHIQGGSSPFFEGGAKLTFQKKKRASGKQNEDPFVQAA